MTVKNLVYLIDIILIFVGVVFVGVSIGLSAAGKKKVQRCKGVTKAVIVDMKKEISTSNTNGLATYAWYPTYEYNVEGQVITKQSRMGQSSQAFYVGQEVELHYNPDNLNEFYVPQENANKLFMIFGIVGGTLLAAAIIVFGVLKKLNM